jgi:hypothetical protein
MAYAIARLVSSIVLRLRIKCRFTFYATDTSSATGQRITIFSRLGANHRTLPILPYDYEGKVGDEIEHYKKYLVQPNKRVDYCIK